MKYLRLFSALILLSFSITGCHRRQERILPPAQAQAPIINTFPSMPPRALAPVQLGPLTPNLAAMPSVPPAKLPKTRTGSLHKNHAVHKPQPATEQGDEAKSSAAASNSSAFASSVDAGAAPVGGSIGQLSADDATANPVQNVQTQSLIKSLEDRLKKLSSSQQAAHKEAMLQVRSFLWQAKQALSMDDLIGAQTLANKAKILLDELLK